MARPSGQDLEQQGKSVFESMGLVCVRTPHQVPLRTIAPQGAHSRGEHMEIDYYVPCGSVCLVGEVTDRHSEKDVRSKYNRYRSQLGVLQQCSMGMPLWRDLGVPECYQRHFRDVRELRGFFIATGLQRFDVKLDAVDTVARFYQSDWDILCMYAESLGEYAKPHIAALFGIDAGPSDKALKVDQRKNGLVRLTHKQPAMGASGLAHLYQFAASPYDLLKIAKVYRRDHLPSLNSLDEYQRPLQFSKLMAIRKSLGRSRDYVFPTSITVVLSSHCQYHEDREVLEIPMAYGSVSVIDGQHRLFSYADLGIEREVGADSRIMVTAVQFLEHDPEEIQRLSARVFVEINNTQTRVRRDHLDAIAYDILGETDSRALAAKVLLLVNERSGRLRGLFGTSQTSLGVIKTNTVLTSLKPLMNLTTISRLAGARSAQNLLKRQGYERLFDADIEQLGDPEQLIACATNCLSQYFNHVATCFEHDWPVRGEVRHSSLEYTKMIAAFVRLLAQFLEEGLDWGGVRRELNSIRMNLMTVVATKDYDAVLLQHANEDMPNASQSVRTDYEFLNRNRSAPTSIAQVEPTATN